MTFFDFWQINKFIGDLKFIREKLKEILDNQRASGINKSESGNFVDTLIAAQVDDSSLTDDEIVTLMLDLMLGGTDTSVNIPDDRRLISIV